MPLQRGSRFRNGVSRIHGRVARKMERPLWPLVRTADVPMRARLELTLPATTQLRALRRIIREALELDEDDELVTSVQSMDCGEGGRLGCRVAIRARRPVDQAALLAAIRRAVDDTTSSARELEAVAISRR